MTARNSSAKSKKRAPRLQDETAAQTFRRLLAAQFAIVKANDAKARRGSVEALHDLRVALRRMRSLTATFAKLHPTFLNDLESRLSTTCDRMGDARDLDVWIALFREWSTAMKDTGLTARHQRQVVRELRERRNQHATEAMACAPYLRVKKVIAEFLRTRHRVRANAPPSTAFAARRILKVRALIAARYRRVGNFSKDPAHDLRRSGRRLRYLTEFFATDLGNESVRAGRWMTQAQAALGKVHDLDNALELSKGLPTGKARAAVRQHLRTRRAAQLKKFKVAWKHYATRSLQTKWQTRLETWAKEKEKPQ